VACAGAAAAKIWCMMRSILLTGAREASSVRRERIRGCDRTGELDISTYILFPFQTGTDYCLLAFCTYTPTTTAHGGGAVTLLHLLKHRFFRPNQSRLLHCGMASKNQYTWAAYEKDWEAVGLSYQPPRYPDRWHPLPARG
jgi:hypothetical protein